MSSPENARAKTHHPGEPQFLQVGEKLRNPAHVGEHGVLGVRDNLAPRIPDPEADPDNYDADAFEWSLIDWPADSEAELQFAESAPEGQPRWDSGRHNTADFVADRPGRYVFELDAPDGSHEWSLHAFPAGEGPPPRLSLDCRFEDGTFVVESNAALAPERDGTAADLETVYLADDRDALEAAAVERADGNVQIAVEALGGESARLHAAAWDGHRRSAMDTVELHPDGTVDYPNRPPEWAKEGVVYQIFPRSWAGEPGETTMDDLVEGVTYLDDLGVDVLWLTPVVPDEATARQFDQPLVPDCYREEMVSGGGPHGYGTLSYFGLSPDLVDCGDPIDAYRAFVEACHDRGIRVVFDLVISHTGRSHPFFQETIATQESEPPTADHSYPAVRAWDHDSKYFDWYDRIDRAGTKKGTVVEPRPQTTGFFGSRSLPNLNYNNVAVREHALAVAEFWSGDVGVDGFRCDIAWGVPRSLWREMRGLVRANDGEFLMLDETIPNDPRMAENAFGMHFDTTGFTGAAHSVATGEAGPGALLDAVRARAKEGFPPHSLVLNMTENHDENRLLNDAVVDLTDPDREAVTDEQWAAGARRQRLCWAAGVLLPGVPAIYYGQERQISRFGEGRHRGSGDPRGRGEEVDSTADVRPGGRQRAFMNWEEKPEEHLAFYRDIVELYHRLDVLKPDAKLRDVGLSTAEEVLAFGRDASHLDGVEGPEQVLVVLNFGETPAEVAADTPVGGTDLVTGESVEIRGDARLTVDDLLVVETTGLADAGSGGPVPDLQP